MYEIDDNFVTFEDLSPNGNQLLLTIRTGQHMRAVNLFTVEIDGSDLTQLTFFDDTYVSDSGGAAWSPDGSQILFTRGTSASKTFWIMDPDGTNARPVVEGQPTCTCCSTPASEQPHCLGWHHPRWWPDGSGFIAWLSDGWNGTVDLDVGIWKFTLDGNAPTLIVSKADLPSLLDGWEIAGSSIEVSPSGDEIAFHYVEGRDVWPSSTTMKSHLGIMNANGSQVRQLGITGQFTVDGGTEPCGASGPSWLPSGDWIAFSSRCPEQRLWLIRPDGTDLHELEQLRGLGGIDFYSDIREIWIPTG